VKLDFRWVDGALELFVLVRPRSAREEVGGSHGGALCVRVHAPPVSGEANDAVRRAVARVLGVRPAAVRLVSGQRGRRKRLRIEGLDQRVEDTLRELATAPRAV
jgi:uncharacterized protein (TIGR00251 family)